MEGNNIFEEYREKMKNIILFLISLVLMTFIISSCSKNPYEGREDAIKEGAALYKQHCEKCHGLQGSCGVCPNLTDGDWKYGGSDRDFFKSISNGRPGGMPAWKGIINKDGIWKIITYLRTLEK